MSVGVIGIGLIGGSIALGLGDCLVFDAQETSLESAAAAGLRVAASIDEVVNLVDVLVIAVPFGSFDEVFEEVCRAASRREKPILVTNVLSVMRELTPSEPNVRFVAGHPMAGTEKSGFAAADPNLFRGKRWVLAEANDELANLVESLGATPLVMPASKHNEIVAQVSQLTHLIAASEVLALPNEDFYNLTAGSFADSTRVAATRSELTSSMVEANRDEVLVAVERFQAVLDVFAEQLRAGDSVQDLFERARVQREKNL